MRELGLRMKVARLRRKISTVLFSERVGVSRDTLNRLEKGEATIALGTYMRALGVLGLEKDMDSVAQDGSLPASSNRLPVSRAVKIDTTVVAPGSKEISLGED